MSRTLLPSSIDRKICRLLPFVKIVVERISALLAWNSRLHSCHQDAWRQLRNRRSQGKFRRNLLRERYIYSANCLAMELR